MQPHSEKWYRNALKGFPFVQALRPLDGETSQSFCDALVEEHITLRAIAAIKKRDGELSRDERAREVGAIEKATSEVGKEYRSASRKIHPDRFGDQYMTKFQELQQAYSVLRDASHRRDYLDGFWGICDLMYQTRQRGERISSDAEANYILSRHRDWLTTNAEMFQPEMPTSRKPEDSQRPLTILGGIFTQKPRQIMVRSLHAKSRAVVFEIPVIQPSLEFYACVSEIKIVIVDGAEEKTLRTLTGKSLEKEKCKDELRVEVTLPDHGVFFVAWHAKMSFETNEGATSRVTPRSCETRIDCFLNEHIALINRKPILLVQARQTTGTLRSTLSHSPQTAGVPFDELERLFWNLHYVVAKARNLERKLIEIHVFMGEKHSSELIALTDVLDNARHFKTVLDQAMEGKRVKRELKTFMRFIATKIESGDATSWLRTVTIAELEELHGCANRLFQIFVDRAISVGAGTDALEAAAQREDLFTPKQCKKLREVRDMVEKAALAELEAVRKQEEEENRLAKLRKQMEENARKVPWGSVVRLFGLKTHTELNGEIGTCIGVADGGRYRVELFSQCRVVSLLEDNVCLLHQYEEKIQQLSAGNISNTVDVVNQTAHQHQRCATETAVDNTYLYASEKPPPEPSSPSPPSESKLPSLPKLSMASIATSVVQRTILVPNKQIGKLYGPKGSNLSHLKTVIGLDKVVVGTEAVGGRREVLFVGDSSSVEKAETFCANILSMTHSPTECGNLLSTEPTPTTKPPPVTADNTSPTATAESTSVNFRHRLISHAFISPRLRTTGYVNKRPVSQLTLHVPLDRKLEKLLGHQSNGLKDVTNVTGLHMITICNNAADRGSVDIQLTGPPNSVLEASKICSSRTNCIRSSRNESDLVPLSHVVRPHGDWATENATPTIESTVLLPSQAVGWLIGKQGRTLSRIADSSVGVEMINVCKFSSNGMQEVQIVGSENGVQLAETECSRILHTMSQHELSTVSTPSHAIAVRRTDSIVEIMHIPREVCGKVIGKNGAHLRQMKRITGVDYINIDPKVVDGSRAVRIKGPEASVAKVVALVEEFLRKHDAQCCRSGSNAGSKKAAPESPPPNVTTTPAVSDKMKANSPRRPNPSLRPKQTKAMRNGFVHASVEIPSSGDAASASSSPKPIVAVASPDGATDRKQSDFLEFLRDQSACLKCSAESFQAWLHSEDINNIDELMEAMEDDDFVRTEMQHNGLKGYKRPAFWKAVTLAGKSQRKPAQPESSEDLECPISHLLMVNDPVMAADGVVYERAAIDAWYARCLEDSGDVRSPMSNEILSTLALTPVNNVRNLAREYAERHRHS